MSKNPNTGEIDWRNQAQVSHQLAEVIDKMVRYDFRQRYQSATEVLRDLELLTTTKIIPGSFSQQTKKPHRLFLVTALIALIFVLTGIALIKFNPKFPKPEHPLPTRSS
ncbi:hypothetical protein [Nostoc sp. FACHB-888]|uniref:hypothetical protein n=1 Tax=Nostoc sp. FACHB-888 TaxID=2692842 RepID=UPI0016821032|nr:hypothetical protein [Nostoc sp. FACHB-888]MBD2248405.1 hypothetical protein [Nostoc sp. FACHB-888]